MRSIALVQYGSVNSLILKLFGANRVARVPHGWLAITLLGRYPACGEAGPPQGMEPGQVP